MPKRPKDPGEVSLKKARELLGRDFYTSTIRAVAHELDRMFREGWRAGKLSPKVSPPLVPSATMVG